MNLIMPVTSNVKFYQGTDPTDKEGMEYFVYISVNL